MTDTYVIKLRGKTIKETQDRSEFRTVIDQFWNLSDISVSLKAK